MGVLQDIESAVRAIKDAEIRLSTVKAHLESIDREISNLISLENHLLQNIDFLKKQKIIALAAEFKKAKTDLTTAQNRLSVMAQDRINVLKSIKDSEKALQAAIKIQDRLERSMENNVLVIEFGRKDGR